jgi:hypothetical protein
MKMQRGRAARNRKRRVKLTAVGRPGGESRASLAQAAAGQKETMLEHLLSLPVLPVPALLFAGLLAAVLHLSRRLARLAGRLERQAHLLADVDRAADRLEGRLHRLEASRQNKSAQVVTFRR